LLLNTAFGFVIPWIFGVWLVIKKKNIVLIIFPLTSVISYTVNAFGIQVGFWQIEPVEHKGFSALPLNLGLFPLLGCFLIYIISKTKLNAYIFAFVFAFGTTMIEFIGVLSGKIIYGNGWNIFYTYFSYLFPYILVYWYYLTLKKLNIS